MNLAVIDESGHVFEPWTDGRAIGYRVTSPAGAVEYIYLNPWGRTNMADATVVLYIGDAGRPDTDKARKLFGLFIDESPGSSQGSRPTTPHDDCDQDDDALDGNERTAVNAECPSATDQTK